jgi:Chemotaxis phosphatase CheX
MSAINVYRDEQITVAQQTIYQISDSLMLPVEEKWQSQPGNVRSEIHFVNKWKGIYLMECTRPFAVSLASLMLSLDPAELSEDDISDVTGEILNTIAGNLKCLLPSDTELSIPDTSTLFTPDDFGYSYASVCVEQSEVSLESELGMLKLSLWHCE